MLDLIIALLATPMALATGAFIVETWLGIRPYRLTPAQPAGGSMHRVVVLVPAHNEERGIAAVLDTMCSDLPHGMRILVVADNCTDRTAEIARACGVEVVERHDAVRRGKGYALDFGRHHLAPDPPGCVIVVDSDTVPSDGALPRLAHVASASARPVQGAYVMQLAPDAGSVARISAAAFYVKNVVRQLGASRLGGPAILTGSGMAFPWRLFVTLPLATGHVAEDLMLGVDLALQGMVPIFEPAAMIVGKTSSTQGTSVQRRRWESGFIQVAGDNVGPVLRQAFRRRKPELAWLALHLLTPPLVALLAIDVLAAILIGVLGRSIGDGIYSGPASLLLIFLTLIAIGGTVISLLAHGQASLLRKWYEIPRYVVWKGVLTVSILLKRETSWIRTDRE